MGAGAALAAAPSPAQRPNVLLVLADDLASWMLGCYGNTEIKTPNLDQLAARGMRMINSFCCTPVCSPSRATLLSGRTPMQHGIYDYLNATVQPGPPEERAQAGPPPSFANEILAPQVFAKAGYRTGYAGKWHLGNDKNPGRDLAWSYTFNTGSSPYQNPTLYRNGQEVRETGYLPEIITRGALEFLDAAKPTEPFFLTVSHFNPHSPYEGHPDRYLSMYKDARFESFGYEPRPAANAFAGKAFYNDFLGNLRKCAASTTALDDQIPPLLKKLDEKGLRDNTVILFVGDNGFLLGQHGLWSKGHASAPINMYEESIGVPCIWNWPGKIPAQATRSELVSFYDVLPTLSEATGVPAPQRNLCGRSYFKLLRNQPLGKRETWPSYVYGNFRYADYVRDQRYKLVLRHDGQGPNELFDIRADRRERVNQFDNPQFLNTRDRLAAALKDWKSRYSS